MSVRAIPAPIQVFARACVPFVLPPTGTMGNNGAFTLGTALSRTLAGCYMWFAAGQIAAGSLAGWYWTTMSSTTAATVFNNTYTSGVPQVVASPTAFVTTGPGAITGVTGGVNGVTLTLPAQPVGLGGYLRLSELWSVNNSASAKVIGVTIGGQNGPQTSVTTVVSVARSSEVFNSNNAATVQPPAGIVGGTGSAAGAMGATTLNLSASAQLIYIMNTALATDWIILEAFGIELIV